MLQKNMRVLGIVSPKGGSGKTTTVANLAVSMSMFNKYILAFDTNIGTASLGLHLDITNPPITFEDVLRNRFSILEAMYFYNKYLQIIPSALAIELKYKPIVLREKIKQLTDYYDILLSNLVNRYDLILIDTAAGFNTESIAAMQTADALLLVTNPELPSAILANQSIEYAKMINKPVIGIILNKVKRKHYELSKEEIEEATETKVIAEIPYDDKVAEAIANRKPAVLYSKRSPASISYKKLAADLLGLEYKESLFDKIVNAMERLR